MVHSSPSTSLGTGRSDESVGLMAPIRYYCASDVFYGAVPFIRACPGFKRSSGGHLCLLGMYMVHSPPSTSLGVRRSDDDIETLFFLTLLLLFFEF